MFEKKLNKAAKKNKPFFFIISYDLKKSKIIYQYSKSKRIAFDIAGQINPEAKRTYLNQTNSVPDLHILSKPIYSEYLNKFEAIRKQQILGNTYLANLTEKTQISLTGNFQSVFIHTKATYKVWLKNKFCVFSPEPFIKIQDGKIYSYPMKGTIKEDKPDSLNLLMNDEKEIAEHITIVDMIRNDLGRIATNIDVPVYRYAEKIHKKDGNLYQTSSKISGDLLPALLNKPGTLLKQMLPAGSICGAPRYKTLEIIRNEEKISRGWYTGICGYYNSGNLDSGVMIRFIEKKSHRYFFRSGGGLTIYSKPENEYDELFAKIYLPIKE